MFRPVFLSARRAITTAAGAATTQPRRFLASRISKHRPNVVDTTAVATTIADVEPEPPKPEPKKAEPSAAAAATKPNPNTNTKASTASASATAPPPPQQQQEAPPRGKRSLSNKDNTSSSKPNPFTAVASPSILTKNSTQAAADFALKKSKLDQEAAVAAVDTDTVFPTTKAVFEKHGSPGEVLKIVQEKLELDPITGQVPRDCVLIELLAAPVNPADLNMIEGTYRNLPDFDGGSFIGGNEGVFVVRKTSTVARRSGRGGSSQRLSVGDWVIPREPMFGTWRTFAIVHADMLVRPLLCSALSALRAV